MKSPLHYIEFMSRTIDLSKLAEVSKAYFIDRMGHGGWFVGFTYRYADSKEMIEWFRDLKMETFDYRSGEERVMKETDEAAFTRLDGERDSRHVLFYAEDEVPRCVVNLQVDVDKLTEAWTKWKEIEPEVYAIIRKHLS
jgi:hypothetical protein